MPRARGVPRSRKRKRILKRAEGFRGARSKLYRTAKEATTRADAYAYRDRRAKKRNFRSLWIIRIGAAARQKGLTYGTLIKKLADAHIKLDRKILADMALNDPEAFGSLVDSLAGERNES